MWVATADLPKGAGHPFYERLNRVLEESGFDAFVEGVVLGLLSAYRPSGAVREIVNVSGRMRGAKFRQAAPCRLGRE